MDKLLRKQKIDVENIKKLLSKSINGTKKPYYLSENPKNFSDNNFIQKVVGKTYEKTIKSYDDESIVILYNYENGEVCKKCNIYFAQLNKVAATYYVKVKNSKDKVKFQAINGSLNEIKDINLSIKPNLFLLQKTKGELKYIDRFTDKWRLKVIYKWVEEQHEKPEKKVTDLVEINEVDL